MTKDALEIHEDSFGFVDLGDDIALEEECSNYTHYLIRVWEDDPIEGEPIKGQDMLLANLWDKLYPIIEGKRVFWRMPPTLKFIGERWGIMTRFSIREEDV